MPVFVTITTLLLSSVAFAYPTVGDQAVYGGIFTDRAGMEVEFTATQELTEYDASTNSYLMRTTTDTYGKIEIAEQKVPASDLSSKDEILSILAVCETGGGMMTEVMVPAGKFRSCIISDISQEGVEKHYAITDVPFAVAMLDLRNQEGRTNLKLKSFRIGAEK